MQTKKCLICGKEFSKKDKGKNFKITQTCSRDCGSKLQTKLLKERNNKYIIQGLTTKLIIRGIETYIDTEDIEKINMYCWGIDGKGYIYKHKTLKEERKSLHRFLLNPSKNMVIDHINHNPLDNCKKNLRIVSQSENLHNCKISKANKSKVQGVSKCYKGWRARIMFNWENKEKHFKTKQEAIIQRKKWEEELKNRS